MVQPGALAALHNGSSPPAGHLPVSLRTFAVSENDSAILPGHHQHPGITGPHPSTLASPALIPALECKLHQALRPLAQPSPAQGLAEVTPCDADTESAACGAPRPTPLNLNLPSANHQAPAHVLLEFSLPGQASSPEPGSPVLPPPSFPLPYECPLNPKMP